MIEPLELYIESGKLTLGTQKLRFVESYEIKSSSEICGKAELTIKMLVSLSDNKQEQSLLTEKG